MAAIEHIHVAPAETGLRARIVNAFLRMQEARARRAVYRQTVRELSALTSRELNDLGLSRSMITRIAQEAAWGSAK